MLKSGLSLTFNLDDGLLIVALFRRIVMLDRKPTTGVYCLLSVAVLHAVGISILVGNRRTIRRAIRICKGYGDYGSVRNVSVDLREPIDRMVPVAEVRINILIVVISVSIFLVTGVYSGGCLIVLGGPYVGVPFPVPGIVILLIGLVVGTGLCDVLSVRLVTS